MEVSRLGVKLELQLQVYATARWDLSRIRDLSCRLWLCRILNPLSEARDQTHILMDTSWVRYRWATIGNSLNWIHFWDLCCLSLSGCLSFFPSYFLFLAAPVTCGSSRARDQTWTTAATREPKQGQCQVLNPLYYQGTPSCLSFRESLIYDVSDYLRFVSSKLKRISVSSILILAIQCDISLGSK